jgi:hypothetical protein
MQISHSKLLNAVPALQAISAIKLPVQTSFRFSRVGRKVEEALADFEQARTNLVNLHADKDVDGNVIDHGGGSAHFADPTAFQSDFQLLLAIEVDIAGDTIRISDLGSGEIEFQFLSALDWLIVE